MHIKIRKGLNVPLLGAPSGTIHDTQRPERLSLNLEPFDYLRFKLLVKVGDSVKIGDPLVENKGCPGVFFASPGGGTVVEIRRGLKRRLLNIVMELGNQEQTHQFSPLKSPSQQEILSRMMEGGAFPYIRTRPFNLIGNPNRLPRDIFVSAVESAPFAPSAEMQIEGYSDEFQAGLNALKMLTTGRVHLVCRKDSSIKASGVERHTVEGPHPAGNPSVHIHHIAPVLRHQEVVWTLTSLGVIVIGSLISKGEYPVERILGIGGEGLKEQLFIRGRAGHPINVLLEKRLKELPLLTISGDPLNGTRVELDDFLGFYDTTVAAIPLYVQRESLHFFRLGLKKFSATRTYLSGFLSNKKKYHFTTNQHGEERAFIDGSVYQKVMPMRIPTMQLIKALLAEDFELAEQLGILEVAPEDFSLPTFICPSKIEMVDIVKRALHSYANTLSYS